MIRVYPEDPHVETRVTRWVDRSVHRARTRVGSVRCWFARRGKGRHGYGCQFRASCISPATRQAMYDWLEMKRKETL